MLQYEGQIVPKSFEWEFVVLSYFVSWIGAILTLELLNRRTLRNGFFNYVILIGAAVAMGAISIYCMVSSPEYVHHGTKHDLTDCSISLESEH